MHKSLKNILTIAIPLIIGVAMIVYQYLSISDQELEQIIFYFKQANYFYITLSIIIMLFAHYIRAYRWQYSIKYLGYQPVMLNNFMSVMVSYFLNLSIPRSGEISRAALLYKYDNVPFDKGIGTIVTERIIDFLVFLFFVFFGIAFNYRIIADWLFINFNPVLIVVILASGGVCLLIFLRIWKHSSIKFILVIKEKLRGLIEGMQSILKIKERKAFIMQSFLIWILYFLMFYVVFLSLNDSQNISINIVLMGFIFGSLAIGLTNGGIGAYPLAVAMVLELFGVDKEIGIALGWLAWTSQTLMSIIIGGLAFILYPVVVSKK